MEFHRVARRRPMINMTNMVDVMMILLIFFVVSTTFLYRPAIPIEPPETTHIALSQTAGILVTIDKAGRIYLDGAATDLSSMRNQLAARLKDSPDKRVVIEADRDAAYGVVVQAVDVVVGSGAEHVHLPTLLRQPEE